MRKALSVWIALVCFFSLYGFRTYQQDVGNRVAILNRSGQEASRITDGDGIQIQIALAQAVTTQQTVTFKIGDSNIPVGSCIIATGNICKTDLFPSLGWHWDAGGLAQNIRVVKAFDSGGSLIGQSEALTVLPRPVILVHGFISGPDAWRTYVGSDGYLASIGLQGFAVGDGQVAGAMNVGSFTDPTTRTNTMAQNAEIEGQYIAAVKKATGAEMVDLVGHSMGGMISRYYIDRVMQERDVAQLIMLGSPMGGSDCSVLPASLGFFLPASLEIRQSYMQGVFNRQITHRRGVEFYDLGGTAIVDSFKSPCADVPNDTVVSFESVNAIPLQSSQFDDIHSDLSISRSVFDDFVRPLLEKPAGSFTLAADPQPAAATPASLQFTRVYTGHVDADGSTEITINIDPNVSVASFALYDATRSVTVSVRGASGNVIQLDPQANGFIRVDDPSSMIYLGYGFENPKPGPWKVSVLATESTPASGADFAISVYFIGGATLDAASNTLIPKLGEDVLFSASLSLNGQPLEITQAQALIRGPDGKTETVDFKPGTQVSVAWTAQVVGTHGVDIIVTGLAPDGSQIERTAFLAVEVQANPSKAQVTLNFITVIAFVILIISLILFLAILFVRWLFRSRR